jgi:hypothetical protein
MAADAPTRDLFDRRVAPGVEEQVRARLPESIADIVPPVLRGGRPRRAGDDHS